MRTLFDKTSLNGMSLKNRFVRSATWEGLATTEGKTSQKLIEMMTSLAKGRRWPNNKRPRICI